MLIYRDIVRYKGPLKGPSIPNISPINNPARSSFCVLFLLQKKKYLRNDELARIIIIGSSLKELPDNYIELTRSDYEEQY